MPLPESPRELETVPFEQLRTLLGWVTNELRARLRDTIQQIAGSFQEVDRLDRTATETEESVDGLDDDWIVTETTTFDPDTVDRLVLERFQLRAEGVPVGTGMVPSEGVLSEHLNLPADIPLEESVSRLLSSGALTYQGPGAAYDGDRLVAVRGPIADPVADPEAIEPIQPDTGVSALDSLLEDE